MKNSWDAMQAQIAAAADLAEAVVKGLDILKPPVDPLAIIESERKRLMAFGEDFGNAFDGRLEYQAPTFLLFYNTKYNAFPYSGSRHPRINFTIAHELGHFFLDRHHQYLKKGGKPHGSNTEFVSDNLSEREADSFAASLLMPAFMISPAVNKMELSFDRIETIARDYGTSLLSTAIRAVRLSGDPCALAGLRGGEITWMFPSDRLIEAACFPTTGTIKSAIAVKRWAAFLSGDNKRVSKDGMVRDWFQLFGQRAEKLDGVFVTEAYLPVPSMDTLIVLLTMDDADLFASDVDESEDDME